MTDAPPPATNPEGADVEQLRRRREIWRAKYPIRACYENWHRIIRPHAREGRTLEIGAGAGLMREVWGEGLVTSDILPTPWIDRTMDALDMDCEDAAFDNLLCIDALHHFNDPHRVIREAGRVVRDGGRLLFIEPWISPLSRVFYGLMHHEVIYFKAYKDPALDADDPWAGNLALPNIVFGAEMKQWGERHPEWRPVELRRFSMLDFQVAGGFKPWALVRSKPLYDLCLRADRALGFMMPLVAFRIMAVFERVAR